MSISYLLKEPSYIIGFELKVLIMPNNWTKSLNPLASEGSPVTARFILLSISEKPPVLYEPFGNSKDFSKEPNVLL